MNVRKTLDALPYTWPFIFGVGFLFVPHFSGWSQIVFPAYQWPILYVFLFWPLLFIAVLVLQGLYLIFAFYQKWPFKRKLFLATLLIFLLSIWKTLYPSGGLGTEYRVSFFPVGGWTRILWAGGPNRLQKEAYSLLETTSVSKLPRSDWPQSIKQLGASAVRVDNQTQTVTVYIRKATYVFDPDQFGYFIRNVNASPPIQGENGRMWKLADGIYFFEEW